MKICLMALGLSLTVAAFAAEPVVLESVEAFPMITPTDMQNRVTVHTTYTVDLPSGQATGKTDHTAVLGWEAGVKIAVTGQTFSDVDAMKRYLVQTYCDNPPVFRHALLFPSDACSEGQQVVLDVTGTPDHLSFVQANYWIGDYSKSESVFCPKS